MVEGKLIDKLSAKKKKIMTKFVYIQEWIDRIKSLQFVHQLRPTFVLYMSSQYSVTPLNLFYLATSIRRLSFHKEVEILSLRLK